jgi:hypothetical protein
MKYTIAFGTEVEGGRTMYEAVVRTDDKKNDVAVTAAGKTITP